jgi:DNA polymerase theta
VRLEANLRAAIVASAPGRLVLSADYAAVELRLMAHFSGDAALAALLRDGADHDAFVALAARWRGVAPAAVTAAQRAEAKELTYGVCYGMGDAALSGKLGVDARAAGRLRADFLAALPGVERWRRSVIAACRADGFVETLSGRRRWIPAIASEVGPLRAQAERRAVNSVCQGSAADVAKAAMVAFARRARRELPPGAAALVLQIHDELLVDVAPEAAAAAAALLLACMEGAPAALGKPLSVPLRVKIKAGPSWGEAQAAAELDVGAAPPAPPSEGQERAARRAPDF